MALCENLYLGKIGSTGSMADLENFFGWSKIFVEGAEGLVSRHFGEGLVKFVSDGLEPFLLDHQLVLEIAELYMLCMVCRVASISACRILYFSLSATKLSSSLSTSFCNFCTDLSANSARASASVVREERSLSCASNESSLWEAFSSDTSRDFRLFPTTRSSSSSSTIFDSPVSARSSARSRSASTIANLRATSSYFLSASSARNLASFNWFSRASILSSSDRDRFSSTFRMRSDSSAACEASASLVVAVLRRSSDLSRSSSRS